MGRVKRINHGKSKTPEYKTWNGIRHRCHDTKNKKWHLYGGKGIAVCDRWDMSFMAFYEDMGPKPPGTSIERIDSNGNYEPGNCRWATIIEQNSNTSRNRYVTFNGETHTLNEWTRMMGFNRNVLRSRLQMGWSVKLALTTGMDHHTKQYAKKLAFNGKELTISQWAEHLTMSRITLQSRLKSGWAVDRALSTPVQDPQQTMKTNKPWLLRKQIIRK